MDGPSDQKRAKPDSESNTDSDVDAASDLGEDWVIFPKEIPPLNCHSVHNLSLQTSEEPVLVLLWPSWKEAQ